MRTDQFTTVNACENYGLVATKFSSVTLAHRRQDIPPQFLYKRNLLLALNLKNSLVPRINTVIFINLIIQLIMFQPKTSPTSFPGPLVFPSPGAREEGKTRGPGNEVETSCHKKRVPRSAVDTKQLRVVVKNKKASRTSYHERPEGNP